MLGLVVLLPVKSSLIMRFYRIVFSSFLSSFHYSPPPSLLPAVASYFSAVIFFVAKSRNESRSLNVPRVLLREKVSEDLPASQQLDGNMF